MHNRLWIAAAFAATPILALSPVAFPASREAGCVRAVAGQRHNHRLFVSLMRRRDTLSERTLALYNVPRVKSREVRPVSDPVVCSRAAKAFGRAFREDSRERKVHVIRVGSRYVVTDPFYRPDDHHRAVTFDSTFTRALGVVIE